MTVQDASNDLFSWFETSDTFEMSRDLKKIVPIFDNEEETTITFRIALEKLEEMQLVASKDYGDKKYYILEKHMDMFQQSVEVGPWSAKFIAGEINEFCQLVQDNTDLCQTSSIQEKDMRNLVHIVQFYKQKVIEKEQIISSEGVSNETVQLLESLIDPTAQEDPPEEDPPSEDEGKKKKKK